MGFGQAIQTCFRKYVTFSGRASRSEYWFFALFRILAHLASLIADLKVGPVYGTGIAAFVVSISLLLPATAVHFRRLHDIGRSGWWVGWCNALWIISLTTTFYAAPIDSSGPGDNVLHAFLISSVIIIGLFTIVIFVFSVLKGTRGPNKYGDDPLAQNTV